MNYTEEQILEPLGGWDNLVLMCEAKGKKKILPNQIEFEVAGLRVQCGKDIDYLFGQVWLLRVEGLYSSNCIIYPSLLRRTFEYYTGYALDW